MLDGFPYSRILDILLLPIATKDGLAIIKRNCRKTQVWAFVIAWIIMLGIALAICDTVTKPWSMGNYGYARSWL